MKYFLLIAWCTASSLAVFAQNNLDYYVAQAKQNSPTYVEFRNAEKFVQLQAKLIEVQNKAINVNFTSDLYFSPYFNNNGNLIAITNMPDSKAIGYDVNVSNGGLYSAQLNKSKRK